jgi:hypothetical protein
MFNNSESQYDLIIGMDTMQAIGIDINFSTKTISWNGNHIPFCPTDYFSDETFFAILDEAVANTSEEEEAVEAGYKSKTILHSLYEKSNTDEVAK